MKIENRTITIGFEYVHPIERRVLVDVPCGCVRFNWAEKLAWKIFDKSRLYWYSDHNVIMRTLISRRMGFVIVAQAERIWNITDGIIIKDRYVGCESGKFDHRLFADATWMTLDKLIQDLNNRTKT